MKFTLTFLASVAAIGQATFANTAKDTTSLATVSTLDEVQTINKIYNHAVRTEVTNATDSDSDNNPIYTLVYHATGEPIAKLGGEMLEHLQNFTMPKISPISRVKTLFEKRQSKHLLDSCSFEKCHTSYECQIMEKGAGLSASACAFCFFKHCF